MAETSVIKAQQRSYVFTRMAVQAYMPCLLAPDLRRIKRFGRYTFHIWELLLHQHIEEPEQNFGLLIFQQTIVSETTVACASKYCPSDTHILIS